MGKTRWECFCREIQPREGVAHNDTRATAAALRDWIGQEMAGYCVCCGPRAVDTLGDPLHLIFAVELHFLEFDFLPGGLRN